MKNKKLLRGFTLIELLVVVLIIGILATVAVPQYQHAVRKAHFANMRALADSLVKACQITYLRTGNFPRAFDELDITLPENMQIVPATGTAATSGSDYCAIGNEFYCCLQYPKPSLASAGVLCATNDFKLAYVSAYADANGMLSNAKVCIQKKEEETFCQHIPGAKPNSSIAIRTPTSLIRTGYTHFYID